MATELTANFGTVEAKKDVLVRDIKTVVGDTDALLRGVAGATADSYAATRAKVEGKLNDAKTRFEETRTQISERAHGIANTGQAFVKDNPWKIAGVTAAIGLVIGYLLSRR
jgi:ElaB/YqjD/DUF883 family membrane-anchored ribosome-binding protein